MLELVSTIDRLGCEELNGLLKLLEGEFGGLALFALELFDEGFEGVEDRSGAGEFVETVLLAGALFLELRRFILVLRFKLLIFSLFFSFFLCLDLLMS